ncbi:hypothetical protein CWB73_21785, partial [Pseudoalteromonas phenolica]
MFADKDLEETRSQLGQMAQVRGPVRTFIKCRVTRSLLLAGILDHGALGVGTGCIRAVRDS